MLRNILYLFGMQGTNYLLPLIILPYLVRVLGPEQYGRLGFSVAIIQYLILLIDFGFNLLSSARIAKNKENAFIVSKIYSATIFAKVCISIIVIFITILLTFFVPKLYDIRWLLAVSVIQIWGAIFTPIWFFQGMEVMKKFAIITVIARFISLPLIFVFVKKPSDVLIAAFLQSCVFAISGVIAFILIRQMGVRLVKIKLSTISSYLKRSSGIFVGTVAISLYTLSTAVILGLVASNYDVGIFNAADKIRAALLGVFVMLGSVFYPRINNLWKFNRNGAYDILRKIIIFQSLASLLLMVLFYFSVPLIVRYYLGEQYYDCIRLLKVMAPMIVLVPASIIMSNYILLPFGYRKFFSYIPVITAFMHFFYAFYLSRNYGAYGACIAILLTELISFMILLVVNLKLHTFKYIFGFEYEPR